jgi:hypothetical protein
MLQLRSNWAMHENDLVSAELVLEFLEEFAALKMQKVLDEKLIWDSVLGCMQRPIVRLTRITAISETFEKSGQTRRFIAT